MGSDPIHIGSAIAESLRRRGWQRRLEIAQVHARWEEIVGAAVAAHCRPERLHADGTLEVAADSATWATQITFLQAQLLDRLCEECGPSLVKAVRVRTNPAGPQGFRGPGPSARRWP